MDSTGSILSYVLAKLGDLIRSDAELFANTREDLDFVRRELWTIRTFLDHVATINIQDTCITSWMEDVRRLAFHTEDVVDTFSLRAGVPTRRYLLSRCCTSRTKWKHDFGTEVAQLRRSVAELSARKPAYDIKLLDAGTAYRADELLRFRRLTAAPYVEDRDVVGLNGHMGEVELLLREASGRRRFVISIVGMGGLGKTTLAKMVHNSEFCSYYFDCTAWVCVSQKYNLPDLLRGIAREIFRKDNQTISLELVTRNLNEFLRDTRYLIVLDDVWTSEVWRQLDIILPDPGNGSRILITTRNVQVARLANPNVPPYMLSALNEEESRDLFTTKVFHYENNPEQCCTGELASLREKIVKKCGGLPLAIIVVGGLLSVREKSPAEWRKVAEKINWQQTEQGAQCMGILASSFLDLPVHLRWCFLSVAATPEDCEVHAKRLMRLWIAEGFIEQGEGESSLEETAERYLEELVNRCLIQVVERTPYGSVEVCRVHNLLLELAVSEAKKTRFLDVWRTATDRCPRTLMRRLSFASASIEGSTVLPLELNGLRTLLIMDRRDWKRGEDTYLVVENIAGNIEWSPIQRNLKLLRVLELGVYLDQLPDEIEHMVNLRYLSLSSYKMIKLPKSLGNLRHLQTLDVGRANVRCLPVSIWRIKTLRYLRGGSTTRFPVPKTSPPIDVFQDLRALRGVRADPWMQGILPKLSNLRELGIYINRGDRVPDYLCGTIKSLQSLEVLVLSVLSENEINYMVKPVLNIDEIFSQRDSHPYLHTLELCDDLVIKSSYNQVLPQNLKRVALSKVRIQHGLIELLGKLPSLHLLSLSEVSIAEEEEEEMIYFKSGWFPRLHMLGLHHLNIVRWELDAESLPLLRELEISHCYRLQALPQSLPPLKELNIDSCPGLEVYSWRN